MDSNHFLTHIAALLGDPDSQALIANGQVPMPTGNLNIANLLGGATSGGGSGPPGAAPPPQAPQGTPMPPQVPVPPPQGFTPPVGGTPPGVPPVGTPPSVVTPSGQPAAPPVQDPTDAVVSSNPIDPSKLHRGILGGGFSVGHTGGNILGALGDAFLTQAGKADAYAPRLQQAREAEALQNYSTDPTGALQRLTPVVGANVLQDFNNMDANNRANTFSGNAAIAAGDTHASSQLGLQNIISDRANALLYAGVKSGDDNTFKAARAQAAAYLTAHGQDPSQLPNSIDEAKASAMGSVPVEKQVDQGDTEDRNAATEALAAKKQQNINDYYNNRIGVETERNRIAAQRAGYSDPSLKAPTPATVLGGIQAKVAKSGYNSLTPGQQKLYDDSRVGKSRPGAGAPAAGTPHFDPAKGRFVIN